jgi:hypothetical protein
MKHAHYQWLLARIMCLNMGESLSSLHVKNKFSILRPKRLGAGEAKPMHAVINRHNCTQNVERGKFIDLTL